ncbi:MAG: envelope stress response membrane protein PspB [Rhodothalassiaceae bacterium]
MELTPIIIVAILFVAMPAVVLHYLTQWRKTKVMTPNDEVTLEELRHLAEKLETRLETMERILDDEVPDWRSRRHDPY